MEVAVNGPDGATHLVLCTGIANLGSVDTETYTFLVGPKLSQRQFVGAIASGAVASIQVYKKNASKHSTEEELRPSLLSIDANYDEDSDHVRVRVKVSAAATAKLAISYNVSILAELPIY